MTVGLPQISYPAFLWYEGYIFLAEKPLNLCATDRTSLEESRQRSGMEHLLDADGRYFDIADWTRIPQFGGFTGFALRLIGSVFAAPVLANERQLTLPEFKKKIAGAMSSRYAYDLDKYPGIETVRKLKVAATYTEALDAVPWVRSQPWWQELLVGVGCLAILGVIVLACWFVGVLLRP
jgi:hypothetical protein